MNYFLFYFNDTFIQFAIDVQTNASNDNVDPLNDVQEKQDDEEQEENEDDDDKYKKAKPTTSSISNKIDTSYYDYLINMSLRNLTKERRNEILKEQQEKHEKLEALSKKSPEDLYEDDLNNFEAEYHKVRPRFLAVFLILQLKSNTKKLIHRPGNKTI